VVPALTLTNLHPDIVIHNLGNSAPTRSIAAATLAGVHRSPATAALLELLSEVTERHLAARQPTQQRKHAGGHARVQR
jgi:molybdopterin synthase catalytic subunit